MRNKIGIGLAKWPAAKEAVVGGEGRRMGGFENEMLAFVDEMFLATSIATPEDKN